MKKFLALSLVLTTAFLFAASAQAASIDFEDQPAGSSGFGGGAQTLNYGPFAGDTTVTFNGGQILTNESGQTTDNTNVYGTSSFSGVGSNPITINFNQAIQNFSVQVSNAVTGNYVVFDNNGHTDFFSLAGSGTALQVASLSGLSNQVSIESIGTNSNSDTADFDFAIDNVNFDEVSAVPLPAALPMFGAALMGLGVIRRRKA